jgi:DNA-binding IclR family transcriptional regulator
LSDLSPAVSRAIQIVGFLAAHPTESFTLSDLCRRLDLNRATADRIVRSLTAAGFLERHPRHLTYALGISLVAIGRSAEVRHPVVAAAQREMDMLLEELGLHCNAVTVDDTGVLVVAETGHGLLGIGTRLPPLPMMGLVHLAYAPQERREAWLTATGLDESRAEFLRGALRLIGERGYAAALRGPVRDRVRSAMTRQIDAPEDRATREELVALWSKASMSELQQLTIDRGSDYSVAYIAAPVFGPAGDVALELVLRNPPDPLSGERVEALARRLQEACAAVSTQIHGRAPGSKMSL